MVEQSQIAQRTLALAQQYQPEERHLLAILQDVQREFNYLPKEALTAVAAYLAIPPTTVYSVATFYKALSLKPKGKHIIKICDGTACHVKGSLNLIIEIKNLLGIAPGETTADGLFSLETVACVGACGLAPVVIIDDAYYGNLTPLALRQIIAQYREAVADAK